MSQGKNELDMVGIRLVPDRKLYSEKQISSPGDAIEVIANNLQWMNREYVMLLNLNAQNQVLNASVINIGGLDHALVSVPEIFKTALLANANSFLMLHNHPSGKCIPSQEDLMITKRIQEAGKLLDVACLGHIIIGRGSYYSIEAGREYPMEVRPDSTELEVAERKEFTGNGSIGEGLEPEKGFINIALNKDYLKLDKDLYRACIPFGIRHGTADLSFMTFQIAPQYVINHRDNLIAVLHYPADYLLTLKNQQKEITLTVNDLADAMSSPKLYFSVPQSCTQKIEDKKGTFYKITFPAGCCVGTMNLKDRYFNLKANFVAVSKKNPEVVNVAVDLNQFLVIQGGKEKLYVNPTRIGKSFQTYTRQKKKEQLMKVR